MTSTIIHSARSMPGQSGASGRTTAAVLATLLACLCLFTTPVVAQEREARNKALVLAFYQQLFGDKDVAAIERYVAEGYIQHNPGVPTGRAAIQQLFTKIFAGAPKTKVDIRRVEGDRIVEHWDVVQPVPDRAANDNTMF